MRRLMALGVAAALSGAALCLSAPSQADETRCAAAVDDHLADLGVPQSEVERIVHSERYQFVDGEEKVVGYEAWIDLESCDEGQLVIVMSRQCRQRTFYTTGDCRIPGGDD